MNRQIHKSSRNTSDIYLSQNPYKMVRKHDPFFKAKNANPAPVRVIYSSK
jgi:hypothetical protein